VTNLRRIKKNPQRASRVKEVGAEKEGTASLDSSEPALKRFGEGNGKVSAISRQVRKRGEEQPNRADRKKGLLQSPRANGERRG